MSEEEMLSERECRGRGLKKDGPEHEMTGSSPTKPPADKAAIFEGVYEDDWPIDRMDACIKNVLGQDYSRSISQHVAEIAQLEALIKSKTLYYNDLCQKRDEIEEHRRQIIEMQQSPQRLNEYVGQTATILAGYRRKKRILDFGRAEVKEEVTDVDKQRLRTIEAFLDVARRYVELDVRPNVTLSHSCHLCLEPLEDNGSVSYCNRCGVQFEAIKVRTQRTNDAPDVGVRSNQLDTFVKRLRQVSGTYHIKPPASVYVALDKYFSDRSCPVGSCVRQMPLKPDGTRGRVTIEEMYNALTATKNNSHFPDLNWILYHYWGWELPDVPFSEEELIADFVRISTVVSKYRSSNTSATFYLYQILCNRGVPCQRHHFKMPISDTADEYAEAFKKACKELPGIEYFSIK
jgi:hypothetical protein